MEKYYYNIPKETTASGHKLTRKQKLKAFALKVYCTLTRPLLAVYFGVVNAPAPRLRRTFLAQILGIHNVLDASVLPQARIATKAQKAILALSNRHPGLDVQFLVNIVGHQNGKVEQLRELDRIERQTSRLMLKTVPDAVKSKAMIEYEQQYFRSKAALANPPLKTVHSPEVLGFISKLSDATQASILADLEKADDNNS